MFKKMINIFKKNNDNKNNELLTSDNIQTYSSDNELSATDNIQTCLDDNLLFLNLNTQQKEAVVNTEGFVRVVAGAGSGKTKVLTTRYAYIVNEFDISTNRILSVTFTNKAASEMKIRVKEMIGDIGTPYISTFHSFCNKVLRKEIERIGYPKNFKILDVEDQIDVLKIVYKDLGITNRNIPYKSMLKVIDKGYKSGNRYKMPNYENVLISSFSKDFGLLIEKTLKLEEKIVMGYFSEQRKNFYLDYNDLINFTLYLFNNYEDIKSKWQDKFDYVQIDEFQDVSMREFELASILSEKNKNLFVVGDPDQTIYSFRHSNVKCILDFDKILAELQGKHIKVKTIKLYINYRSTPQILEVSNSLIEKNTKRISNELITKNKPLQKVTYYHAKSTYDEADWISKKIKELNCSYSDVLILYRTNATSRSIEEGLIRNKIPYQILSGISFFQRKEIKDILAILSLIVYEDNLSFSRVLKNNSLGIGQKRIEVLKKEALEKNISLYQSLKNKINEKPFSSTKGKFLIELIESLKIRKNTLTISEIIDIIIDSFNYEELHIKLNDFDKYENIMELKEMVKMFEKKEKINLETYLEEISLYSNIDKVEKKDKVKLMTIHSAKGLESPIVFVVGMNEGIMPHCSASNFDLMEEERRIAYVGITRAKKLLFLTEAEGVNYNNLFRYPSRFLYNIDKDKLITKGNISNQLMLESKKYIDNNEIDLLKRKRRQYFSTKNKRIKINDRVVHEIFGSGLVIEEDVAIFKVAFDSDHVKGINKYSDKIQLLEKG